MRGSVFHEGNGLRIGFFPKEMHIFVNLVKNTEDTIHELK